MEDTSERIILSEQKKNEADYYVYLLHLASYNYATKYAKGNKVLDYGCGTGYGSKILSKVAESVIGIDISSEAIIYAQNNFGSPNTYYLKIENGFLPFNDNSFDLITSFQVIEHIYDTKQYLNEIERVLKPGGLFLLTTPDRETRLFTFQKPWNYYHMKEYSILQLKNLLSNWFNNIIILKIGGNKQLIYQELRRRKFTKIITLPFTLSIFPDVMRKFFLGTLKKLYYSKPQILAVDNDILKYTAKDIIFNHELDSHTDLLAICKKTEK